MSFQISVVAYILINFKVFCAKEYIAAIIETMSLWTVLSALVILALAIDDSNGLCCDTIESGGCRISQGTYCSWGSCNIFGCNCGGRCAYTAQVCSDPRWRGSCRRKRSAQPDLTARNLINRKYFQYYNFVIIQIFVSVIMVCKYFDYTIVFSRYP